jgi:hypothetical protein
LKLPEENTGEILLDIGIGNDFLNRTPIAQEIARRTNFKTFVLKFCLQQSKQLT